MGRGILILSTLYVCFLDFYQKMQRQVGEHRKKLLQENLLPEPTQEEVQQLIAELKSFAKVNVKDNALEWYK